MECTNSRIGNKYAPEKNKEFWLSMWRRIHIKMLKIAMGA